MSQRSARLRPIAARRYPAIETDHWYPAAVLAHYVHRREGSERGSARRRTLADELFEFVGGASREGSYTPSRREDRAVRAPAGASPEPRGEV